MQAIGIAPTLTLGALLRFGIVAALAYIATRAVRPAVRYGAAITIGGDRGVVVPGGVPQRGGGGPPVDGGLTVTPRS